MERTLFPRTWKAEILCSPKTEPEVLWKREAADRGVEALRGLPDPLWGHDCHPRLASMASGARESGEGSHLIAPVLADELRGHVCRKHVFQEQPSQVLHRLRLFPLLPQLLLPQEVQAAIILILGRSPGGHGETQRRGIPSC